MKKRLVIVGGANGVGKTTFAMQYKAEYGLNYLGADEIAKELSAQYSGNIELKAGKEFFRRLDEVFSTGASIIIESTLSGLSLLKKIQEFKKHGYSIEIVYVFLLNVQACKKRVRLRAKKGGHSVPPQDIERRYYRSIENFRKSYSLLADKWQLLYNGHKRPVEAAVSEDQIAMVLDEEYYNRFMETKKCNRRKQ